MVGLINAGQREKLASMSATLFLAERDIVFIKPDIAAFWNGIVKTGFKVITLAISSFFAVSGGNTHMAAAAAVTAIVPITILYVALQRYFVQGVLDSALK